MTSTNVNVGIEGRSSNRIVKPPGGAHTDIFGHEENVEVTTSRFSKHSQKSSINECFGFGVSAPSKQEVVTEIHETVKTEIHNENGVKNGTPVDENTKPVAGQRVRVPPGGFSSGLW